MIAHICARVCVSASFWRRLQQRACNTSQNSCLLLAAAIKSLVIANIANTLTPPLAGTVPLRNLDA